MFSLFTRRQSSSSYLACRIVDDLISMVRKDTLQINLYDHTEPVDYTFRTVDVCFLEGKTIQGISGAMIPLESPLVRGINGSFHSDGISMSKDDNKRFREVLSTRILQIAQATSDRLLAELGVIGKQYLNNKNPMPYILETLKEGSLLSIHNFGEPKLPVDQTLLRLNTQEAIDKGLAGLLGARHSNSRTCVLTDGTYYIISSWKDYSPKEKAKIEVYIRNPRFDKIKFEYYQDRKLIKIQEQTGEVAFHTHFAIKMICDAQYREVTKSFDPPNRDPLHS